MCILIPPLKKDKCCYDSHHTHKETEAHKASNTGKQSWEQITRSLPLETPLFFTLGLGWGVESGTLSSGSKGLDSTTELCPSPRIELER